MISIVCGRKKKVQSEEKEREVAGQGWQPEFGCGEEENCLWLLYITNVHHQGTPPRTHYLRQQGHQFTGPYTEMPHFMFQL
jgi:hypothetical protein